MDNDVEVIFEVVKEKLSNFMAICSCFQCFVKNQDKVVILSGLTKTSRDAGMTPGHLDRLIERCTIPWTPGQPPGQWDRCVTGPASHQVHRLAMLNLFSVKFTYTRSLVPLFSVEGYRSLYRVRVSFR